MKVTKRVIAIFLSTLMIFCALPFSIVASAASVKSASVICGDLTFVVPEVIYLMPDAMSWKESTSSSFQMYVNNNSDGSATSSTYSNTEGGISSGYSTGKIYYTLSGASNATISYKFYDENLSSALSGGSATLSSTSISSGGSVDITAGKSPSLAAGTNGCYVEWCLSYTDPSDNIAKKAYAYTYVYKPYVVPVAAGCDGGTGTSGGANWAGSITWISGIQGIESDGTWTLATDYDDEYNHYYIKYGNFSAFISPVSTAQVYNTSSSSYPGVQKNGSANYDYTTAGYSKCYAVFYNCKKSSINGYTVGINDFSNNGPQCIAEASNYDSTFKVANYTCAKYRANQKNVQSCVISQYRGLINIDTSRYTNLNQIPNLAVGLIVTDDEDSGSKTGTWYISDNSVNCKGSSGYDDWHGSADTRSEYYNDHGDLIAGEGTSATDCSKWEGEGIRYAGAWPRTLLGTTSSTTGATQDYYIKGFYGNKDGGYYASSHNVVKLRASYYNKGTLRTAVNNATKLMAKLGVNGTSAGGTLTSCYFDANTSYNWIAFQTAYKNAVIGLTKLSATTNPDTLASELNSAIDGLKTKYTLNANGGTLNTSTLDYYVDVGTSTPGVNQSVSVSPSSSITGTRTGYTFAGWSTSSTGTAASTVTVGYNNTVYAIWNPITYTIKFNANGGIGTMADQTLTYDTAANLTANAFTRTGYTLSGWDTSSSGTNAVYSDKQSVKNLASTQGTEINLYAVWKPLTYKVRYNAVGGTGTMADSTFTYGISGNLTANGFSKTGYTFGGWDSSSSAKTKVYSDKQSVLNLSSTQDEVVNIYAYWIANTYKLNFYPNADDASCSTTSQTVTYDSAVGTLPTPVRTNYYFNGWNTKSDSTGSYYVSSTVYKQAQDTDLYANWTLPAVNDSYVIDYGTPVMLDVLSNDASGITLKSVSSGTGFTASISNGKVKFTPTDAVSGEISFIYTATYKDTDFTATVKVIPATNVYYEESFITFTDGSAVTWQDAGSEAEDAVQTVDSLYGSDSSYSNSSTYSLGSAKYATVTSSNKKGATATFTFTGTGFDFYSLMSGSTGCAFVDIYQGTDTSGTNVYSEVINTYFGYSYGELYLKDGKVSLDSTGTPIYVADADHPGEFFIRGSVMGTAAVTSTRATGWVQGGSSDNSTIYQVPVISKTGLDYGTYTVVIEPRYSKAYDVAGKGSYNFYVDGFRVYDPINPATVTEGTDAYTAYTADNEYNPTYATLRSLLDENLSQVAFLETYEHQATIAEYDNIGPNNEIYLSQGQSISFNLTTTSNIIPDKISIGTKMVEGSSGILGVDSGEKSTSLTITGTSDIYRDISQYVVWGLVKNVYTTTYPITITNNSGDGIVISLTKLKWSYGSAAASSAKSTDLVFSFDDEDLVKVNAMMFADTEPDALSSEGVILKWDKTSVTLGETATLTITAPATFERAYYGAEVIPGYTENEDGTRSWTCTCTPTELQNVIYDVTLEDINGYKTDAIASEILNVVAPTVDINDAEISWEKDAVKIGEEAVLNITTPMNITKVTVGDTDITDFTVTDGKKVFTYKVTNETAGKYVYSVSMTETFGYTSKNANSPALTVEQYVVDGSGITTEWQSNSVKAGESAVLVVTTPADITSVTVAGKTVTESKTLDDGSKQFTVEIDTTSQGENSYAVTVTDSKGMTSASVATDVLKVTSAEAPASDPADEPASDPDNNNNAGDNTEEEHLTFWQKLIKAFVNFWRWLVSLVKGLVK